MMKTINISLPAQQLAAVQDQVEQGFFASISEAIRDAIRAQFMKPQLTENGFTPESEESLLRRLNDPHNKIIKFPKGLSTRKKLEMMLENDDL